MSSATIRSAYSMWPQYNQRLRDIVAAMTDEQLALRQPGHGAGPSAELWPIWATVGHTACQRVFWLCDFVGEPGADTTPFTNASYNCPGDDDLVNVLGPEALVEALDSTFRIVDGCLDRWTLDVLDEELRRSMGREEWVHTRGSVLQRVFSHDVYHVGELSQTLGVAGLPQIDLWD
jgi:DinB superfamily